MTSTKTKILLDVTDVTFNSEHFSITDIFCLVDFDVYGLDHVHGLGQVFLGLDGVL